MNSIKNTCVRVKLTMGKHAGYVTDKEMSNQIESQYKTHGRLLSRKRAFKDCAAFAAVQSSCTAISQEYQRSTLAWDEGSRVCKAKEVMDVAKKIGELKSKLDENLNKFLDRYDDYVSEDIAVSNGLMKQTDYPSATEMRDKYYVTFRILPMPGPEDFRVLKGLDEDDIEKLKSDAMADEKERVSNAVKEARNRLIGVTTHLAERLKEYKGAEKERLHKSLLGNVEDCISVLRKLNITEDQEFESCMQELESNVLNRTTIDRLKILERERTETVEEVQRIIDKMSFFGGNNNV